MLQECQFRGRILKEQNIATTSGKSFFLIRGLNNKKINILVEKGNLQNNFFISGSGTIVESKFGKYIEVNNFSVKLAEIEIAALKALTKIAPDIDGQLFYSLMAESENFSEKLFLLEKENFYFKGNFLQNKNQEDIEKIEEAINQYKLKFLYLTFFYYFKINTSLAVKCIEYFTAKKQKPIEVYHSLLLNPYRLLVIDGIGFKTCDQIYLTKAPEVDQQLRINYAIKNALQSFKNNGSTASTLRSLQISVKKILNNDKLEFKEINKVLSALVDDGKIGEYTINDKKYFFSLKYAEKEAFIADFMLRHATVQDSINKYSINSYYDPKQQEAISNALHQRISLIVGGPGRGKTTLIKGIIEALQDNNINDILMCSLTGIAAKKIAQVTGMKAYTISKLLTANLESKIANCQTLIIDECFIIDVESIYELLKKIATRNQIPKIILVGDVQQLEPVGNGKPVEDIYAASILSTTVLERNFRNQNDSSIPAAAEKIIAGQIPRSKNGFYYLNPKNNAENSAMLEFKDAYNKLLAAGNDYKDIHIITPNYNGEIGINNINRMIQRKNCHQQRRIIYKNQELRLGDRVVYNKNDYEINLYNGDAGYIEDLSDEIIAINFNGIIHELRQDRWDNLELYWCSSIHKSQGSEFPIVITLVAPSNFILLNRRLLNTAITRAKKISILIGDQKALRIGLSKPNSGRVTLLEEMILNPDFLAQVKKAYTEG